MTSFNTTIDTYRALLVKVEAGNLELVNDNFDVGTVTVAGQYLGADLAYDKLMSKLADHKFAEVSAELRGNILTYYKDRKAPLLPTTKKIGDEWAKLLEQRAQLEQLQPQAATAP